MKISVGGKKNWVCHGSVESAGNESREGRQASVSCLLPNGDDIGEFGREVWNNS